MILNDAIVSRILDLVLSDEANGKQSATGGSDGLNGMVGAKVIVRTYSAGVWFGRLDQKSGNEVILIAARRMWRWWAADSISLSACAVHGIKRDQSKIVAPVGSVWLEAIEIIPCTEKAIESIEGAPHVQAE